MENFISSSCRKKDMIAKALFIYNHAPDTESFEKDENYHYLYKSNELMASATCSTGSNLVSLLSIYNHSCKSLPCFLSSMFDTELYCTWREK